MITNSVMQFSRTHLFDKTPGTVEKNVRKWVESIGKDNIEMKDCELSSTKNIKKPRKIKLKKKPSLQSAHNKENHQNDQKPSKPKAVQNKEVAEDKAVKDSSIVSVFENLKDNYKNIKLPPNWVSGQSRKRLIFCKVRVVSNSSQFEMIFDRGVIITSDCLIHVFIDGLESTLSNWKLQKVETTNDVQRTIKAVDGFKVQYATLAANQKGSRCLLTKVGRLRTSQQSKSDLSNMRVSGVKLKPKTNKKDQE